MILKKWQSSAKETFEGRAIHSLTTSAGYSQLIDQPTHVINNSSNKLSRDVLFRIYKFFVRPNLDYGDIVYNKPNNESFTSKLERTQYKAYLAITVAIRYIP